MPLTAREELEFLPVYYEEVLLNWHIPHEPLFMRAWALPLVKRHDHMQSVRFDELLPMDFDGSDEKMIAIVRDEIFKGFYDANS